MFSIFKLVVLLVCFSILPNIVAPHPTIEQTTAPAAPTTTPNIESEVEEEFVPFTRILNKIVDIEDRAELRAKLDMVLRRAIKADSLLTEIGRMEKKRMEYAALTTVRCQMEYLEQTLFPYDIYRNPRSRFLRWMIIMTTPGDDRELYTEAVLSEYREAYPGKNDQELKELYASVMQDLYNDMSSVPKSFHSNIDAEVLHYINEKFSKALAGPKDCIEDKARVRWYITLFGLKYEQRYVRAIRILSADRNFTGRRSLKSGSKAISDLCELSCILIMPEDRKDTFPSGVTENDVNEFFPPASRPMKVKIDLGKDRKVKPQPVKTKDGKTLQIDWADKIIAEFKDHRTAMDAFDERQRWLKGQKVQVLPVACEN